MVDVLLSTKPLQKLTGTGGQADRQTDRQANRTTYWVRLTLWLKINSGGGQKAVWSSALVLPLVLRLCPSWTIWTGMFPHVIWYFRTLNIKSLAEKENVKNLEQVLHIDCAWDFIKNLLSVRLSWGPKVNKQTQDEGQKIMSNTGGIEFSRNLIFFFPGTDFLENMDNSDTTSTILRQELRSYLL